MDALCVLLDCALGISPVTSYSGVKRFALEMSPVTSYSGVRNIEHVPMLSSLSQTEPVQPLGSSHE